MKKYTHKKGAHSISMLPLWIPRIWTMRPDSVSYRVMFDETAEYKHADSYQGWNKIFGVDATPFSPANLGWSHMFAWRWKDGQVEIAAYTNKPNGEWEAHTLCAAAPNKPLDLEIRLRGDEVLFVVWKAHRPIFNTVQKGYPGGFLAREIRPWFGGIYTAPHDINIFLKKV